MKVTKTFCVRYVPADKQQPYAFSNLQSRYGATSRYVTYSNRPVLPIVGEMHFSRYDRELWERELEKMKAQGLDSIATYVFWNHHETKCGQFDFSGNRDIGAFLGLCKKVGLKVVLRIGPWCHGEVKRGGFPDFMAFVPGKRFSTPLYLYFVKRFWQKLQQQVAPYCDGETVIGIQLENEYFGSLAHIVKLRNIAEQVGFRTPFFTMTAWPTNTPDRRFLPMFGGYPEAPWAQHKRPLQPEGRFAITQGRSEVEIGEDLNGTTKRKADFSDFPYATCEIGTGNQVTQHRRPIISEADGYGVAFAKFASGANWLGYYMYHGGRNPSDRPMQESRRTLYPNDYPIVDYDFQAPISKDGDVRAHADRLRLMHYFIAQNAEELAPMQTFFAADRSMPYASVRSNRQSGYLFLSNYERGDKAIDTCIDATVQWQDRELTIKDIDLPWGSMCFFPLRCTYGGIEFDYITAQPIVSVAENDATHVYFAAYSDTVRIARGGAEERVSLGEYRVQQGDKSVTLHLLTLAQAKQLYWVDGKVMFSDAPLYRMQGKWVCESKSECEFEPYLRLQECAAQNKPFDSYLFSDGRRKWFALQVDGSVLDGCEDVEVMLEFCGLNLQIFRGDTLVDDCFNTNGTCVFRLRRILGDAKSETLWIRACAATARGQGHVYSEIPIPPGEIALHIRQIKRIHIREIGE